jgi:hypothetical protein
MMVSEAEQVLNDVLKSTSELKELLAFSAKLQHSVCLLDFVSSCACMEQLTRVISFEGTEKESYFCTSHVKDIN